MGSLEAYAAFLKAQGFNAVRVPLSADVVLGRASCGIAGVYTSHNPHLEGLGYLEILESFVELLGAHSLLVLLDVHNMAAGDWPEHGWPAAHVDPLAAVQALEATWDGLTERFCDPSKWWHVFAADLCAVRFRARRAAKVQHAVPTSRVRSPVAQEE